MRELKITLQRIRRSPKLGLIIVQSVIRRGGTIERLARLFRVIKQLHGDTMRAEQRNHFLRRDAYGAEIRNQLLGRVAAVREGAHRRGLGAVGAAHQGLYPGPQRAGGDGEGGAELDDVGGADVELGAHAAERVACVVEAAVLGVRAFVGEEDAAVAA